MSEAKVAESLKKEGPGYGVERLRNVELEKDARGLEVVKQARRLLDKEEVVVNTPSRNEGALVGGDHFTKSRSQPQGENLGK